MSSPFLNIHGDPIPREEVPGSGGSAVVLLQNEVAVKVRSRYLWSSDSDVRANTENLRREQAVYRRLQCPEDERSSGVVRCIRFSTEATQLTDIANRDLQAYLAKCRPSHQLQLTYSVRWLAHLVILIIGACLSQISPAGIPSSIRLYPSKSAISQKPLSRPYQSLIKGAGF
jgi:hypothetical protein